MIILCTFLSKPAAEYSSEWVYWYGLCWQDWTRREAASSYKEHEVSVLQLSQHVILYLVSILERNQRQWRTRKYCTLDVWLHTHCYFLMETGRSCKRNVINEGYFQIICISLQHSNWKVKADFLLQASLFCCTSDCCALSLLLDTNYFNQERNQLSVSAMSLCKASSYSVLCVLWMSLFLLCVNHSKTQAAHRATAG